jgi:hypothetical protein
MRDRFQAPEVWKTLGLPVQECIEYQENSEIMRHFRNALFMRIVPIVKDIGLWGPIVQEGYGRMGVLDFAQTDIEELQKNDDNIARELDARRAHVESVIAEGKRLSS